MDGRPVRQRILITGASSGLGAGMARLFAERGRDLALTARRTDRLEALRAELLAANPTISVAIHHLDVDDHDAVFTVFERCRDELGGLDRVVVNAGLGKGARIGSGRFDANRQTAMTNFVSALAQCEAAVQALTAGGGHLAVISSVTAARGMPGAMTTYAATKAGIAALAEGIRADQLRRPVGTGAVAVSTLFPGYIASEMNEQVAHTVRHMVDTETGCRAMVDAIESEVDTAAVPSWPWRVVMPMLRYVPLRWVRRLL